MCRLKGGEVKILKTKINQEGKSQMKRKNGYNQCREVYNQYTQ
jgi:hypothetical protein